MKRKLVLINIIISIFCLTGCGKSSVDDLSKNINRMELTGNLVTYQAYYHNVIEYEKDAGTGITHLLEKDRKLFAEYTGTIKLGIDLTKVKIDVSGNEINVTLPKAIIIGKPNVDEENFKAENFIESKDGVNKNSINIDDMSEAFNEAQNKMRENAENDNNLLSIAQKRAKVILEENIKQFSGVSEKEYNINWEYQS